MSIYTTFPSKKVKRKSYRFAVINSTYAKIVVEAIHLIFLGGIKMNSKKDNLQKVVDKILSEPQSGKEMCICINETTKAQYPNLEEHRKAKPKEVEDKTLSTTELKEMCTIIPLDKKKSYSNYYEYQKAIAKNRETEDLSSQEHKEMCVSVSEETKAKYPTLDEYRKAKSKEAKKNQSSKKSTPQQSKVSIDIKSTTDTITKNKNEVIPTPAKQLLAANLSLEPSKARGSDFKWSNGILFYKEKAVMNAFVEITDLMLGDKEYYRCKIHVRGVIHERTLSITEYHLGRWILGIPLLKFHCASSVRNQIISLYLEELIDRLDERHISRHLKKPGWHNINEFWYYVTPEGVIGNPSLKIKSNYGKKFGTLTFNANAFRDFLEMVNITKTSVASIMILYDVLSASYTIFKKAGFVPKFILFLCGEKGCLKTSLSIALSQIEEKDHAEYNFKATEAGLETAYKSYRDSILLVDDLFPSKEGVAKTKMLDNLELLIRSYGDGTGKKRNYDFQDMNFDAEQYTAEGGNLVTGEYIDGAESSLARCLILRLKKGDVDKDKLSFLQNNSIMLEHFLVSYIASLSEIINNRRFNIFEFISNQGKKYRNEMSKRNYSNLRYAEYIAHFRVTVDLLMLVARSASLLTEQEIVFYSDLFYKAIEETIDDNNSHLVSKSPVQLICNAIEYSINTNKCHMLRYGEHIDDNMPCIYYTDKHLYIKQEVCHEFYREYISEHRIATVEISSTRMASILEENGLIKSHLEGTQLRKAKRLGEYQNIRYMEINRMLFDKILSRSKVDL